MLAVCGFSRRDCVALEAELQHGVGHECAIFVLRFAHNRKVMHAIDTDSARTRTRQLIVGERHLENWHNE